jgi:hypothetical protein
MKRGITALIDLVLAVGLVVTIVAGAVQNGALERGTPRALAP